jgi:hypothetical protein
MSLRLICALPNPGCPGAPRGLFFADDDTGRARAREFAQREDRPGWGVFESLAVFKDTADMDTFSWVLKQNGWER